jgi:hypothetical protein
MQVLIDCADEFPEFGYLGSHASKPDGSHERIN